MDDIKDNPSDTWSDKFNFLEYAINKWSIDGKNWLLDRVIEDDKLIKQFVRTTDASSASEDDSNTAIPWNEAGISQYFKAVEKFKEQLFVLVHLTAGAPARGTESVTVAYENGVDDRGYRGVFVDNGLVSFVTSYNKTGVKVIYRYVPREVSELVVYYLCIEDSMYGRMSRESPWITMREKDAFRKVSIDWHRIIGFQPVQTEGRNTAKSLVHMEQQAEADKFQRWRAFRQADMLDAFKRMMGPDAEFRGVQFAILQALMQGYKNVLGIMPTGGGKSLTFMLPARCSPGGVTIVVIPLTALEGDIVRRCKESDIKCAVWDAARPPEWASIVFVTLEAAVGQAFKRFMQQKKSTGELDRLVIDECHVVLDSRRKTAERDAWRPEILELYKTVEQSVQTLFLTATLPPRNELEFFDRMGINKHEIVKFRDSTTRKEIKY
ncbi:hypothetical protein D6D26_09901 [Aureobasidium pullulans]|nr:hypothetical protein D6D26_09901 [Aureobasidium pullulans]